MEGNGTCMSNERKKDKKTILTETGWDERQCA